MSTHTHTDIQSLEYEIFFIKVDVFSRQATSFFTPKPHTDKKLSLILQLSPKQVSRIKV